MGNVINVPNLVSGPASSVNGNLASFSGTTGALIVDSGVSAAGVVVGPASAVDSTIALYDGTTGKLIKGSTVTVSPTGDVLFGSGDGTATPVGGILAQPDAAGTDIAGVNFEYYAGNGTGTGGSGSHIWKIANVGVTGAATNTLNSVMFLQKDATYGTLWRLVNKDGSAADGGEIQMGNLGIAAFPRTHFLGGQDATDTNWAMRFAHKDSSSSVEIPVAIQLSTNKDTAYTNADSLVIFQSSTLAYISTLSGAGSDGTKLNITTKGSTGTLGIFMDTVANSQKVGIMIDTPSAQLHVKSSSVSLPGLIVDTQAAHAADVFDFKINGTRAMGMASSGKVGIGNITPLYQLDIRGDGGSGTTNLYIKNTNTGGYGGINFANDGADDANGFGLGGSAIASPYTNHVILFSSSNVAARDIVCLARGTSARFRIFSGGSASSNETFSVNPASITLGTTSASALANAYTTAYANSATVKPLAISQASASGYAFVDFYSSAASLAGGIGYANGSAATLPGTMYISTVARDFSISTDSGTTQHIKVAATSGDVTIAKSGGSIGFFATTPAVKQTSGANLTNNVSTGGTDDQIDNWTDLTTYATDAAAIRNAVYQLSRKLKQINDGLRTYGLFT